MPSSRFSLDRRWIVSLCLGQLLSLCITATSTASATLWKHYRLNLPFTQNCCNYLLLAVVYGVATRRSRSTNTDPTTDPKTQTWWPYIGFSLVDVQANVFAVLAFRNTSVLSVLVLSSWTLPCIMLLTWFLGARYGTSHVSGVTMCLAGLGMLIWSDTIGWEESTVNHSWIGDLICLLSATLYAVSNVIEECLVHRCTTETFLSRVGLWGLFFCGAQAIYFEAPLVVSVAWSGPVLAWMALYVVCLFCMYSLVPTVYRLAGATFLSMSLITSNFYSLLIGLLFLDAKMPPLYPLSYACVIAGVTTYNWAKPPTPQAEYQPLFRRTSPTLQDQPQGIV